MGARGAREVGPVFLPVAAERHADDADLVAGRVFDQRLHARHVGPRITIGHQFDTGRLAQQQRRGSGTVALHEKAGIDRVRIERQVVHFPEIESDEPIVFIPGQATVDLR